LRFPEFDEEWEVKKLGEVASNKSGKYNPINATDSIKCIELEHLATETGQLLGYTDGSKSGSIKNVFNEGDVLFGKLRPYLKKYLQAPFDGVCSSEIWVLKGKNISNAFLYRIVQTNSFIDLANQSSGSKMPRADWNVVENGFFSIPLLLEQQKIASFLSLIDERIQTQNKIIEELKILKATLAQKIFSQQLRFKDDNGMDFPDWEVKKLGTVLSIPEKLKPEQIEKEKLLTVKLHLKGVLKNGSTESLSIGSTNYYIRKKGQFIYGKQNLFNGAFGIIPDEFDGFLSSSDVPSLNIDSSKLNNLFLFYFFGRETFYRKLEDIASGSGSKRIHEEILFKVQIQLPSLEEQTKISNFLSKINEKTETENGILDQYQKQKKHLLHQMFV
jgi:type I restriction enzyme S subunit